MESAFVLVTCEVNKRNKVANQLERANEVKNVQEVFGAYDCVALVDASSHEDLKTIVSSKIRNIEGVRSTLTLQKNEG